LQYGCDKVFSLGYIGPIFCPVSQSVTIHDCNWMDCPEDFTFLEKEVLKFLIGLSMLHADSIMTDSHFSLQRLIYYFPQYKDKIQISVPGLSHDFLNASKRKYMYPITNHSPYVLCISGFYPHKRIPYLFDLWEEIEKRNTDLKLVLIGAHGKDENMIQNRVKYMHRVIYKPFVSEQQLVAYYQYAKISILPSIYEGYGYPAYESLYHRIPTFVGRKEMYEKKVQRFLHQLTFSIFNDASMILSTIKNKK
jgi:glycosyltransferase involved in cell wall biosynthesis